VRLTGERRVKIQNIIPPSNLLEGIQSVESGLRQLQRLGRLGQIGFLVSVILQIVVEADLLPKVVPGSAIATAIRGLRIASAILLPLFIVLFAWSKFWLKESRQPFRYSCSVEPIKRMEFSLEVKQLRWLAQDLCKLLSQRIERLEFVNAIPSKSGSGTESESKGAEGGDRARLRSQIRVGGTYVVRPQVRPQTEVEASLALEIMPDISIGVDTSPKTLAYPVCYPPDAKLTKLEIVKTESGDSLGEIKLKEPEYRAMERVYSSIATEIYRQIQTDVASKIALMPSSFLRALAFFYEAEDYAHSNTLHAYSEAGKLYDVSARLFDACLNPFPISPFRRFWSKIFRESVRAKRRLTLGVAPSFLRLAERELMCARALIGYSTMLMYRRVLAMMSGQPINSSFEACPVARDVWTRLSDYPKTPREDERWNSMRT
jgi:hypothetical protein